jgi:putative membrane protein (TIGR04086 family)
MMAMPATCTKNGGRPIQWYKSTMSLAGCLKKIARGECAMGDFFAGLQRIKISSPLLAGIVNAFILLCLGAVIISFLMAWTDLKEDRTASFAFALHALACLFGGFSSGKRAQSKGWYHGALVGIVYTVIVALVGFLGYDSSIGTDTLALLGIAAAGGMLGGMIGVNAKKS